MGTNSFQADKTDGVNTIHDADVNEFRTALTEDVVPRNASGAPQTNVSDLGTDTYRWKTVNCEEVKISGTAVDVSAIKASGIDYVVNSAGGDDYTTITAALAAASLAGGSKVILVKAGTYTEDINISANNIVLKGVGPQTNLNGNCVISGSYNTFERFLLSNNSKSLSIQTTGNYTFIDKVWINGTEESNFSTDATIQPICNMHFYTEE